ncbi:MAG: hypothetical protein Q9206_004038 [Seirophora lacunosa]
MAPLTPTLTSFTSELLPTVLALEPAAILVSLADSDPLLGLPDNIRCCTKASCGSGGNCRFTSTCASGRTLTGLCPGPTDFKCCLPGTSPSGGFPAPRIPGVGACKAIAVSGAQKVVNALPGRVREIFCIRDCACSSSSSEHCCGKAIDYMCTSGGGVRNDAGTANGLAIRNWVQANAGALNVKYIIWGQQIWSPARAGEGWRNMEDRGSITANHWYGLPRISLLYRSFLA